MAKKQSNLDWYTVKYKDIYSVIAAIVLIIVVGGGGFLYWRWAGNPEGKAERAISKARKLLDSFDRPDLRQEQQSTVTQARATFAQAEGEFNQKRFPQAFQLASDVVETLTALKERDALLQKFALLQEIEGQVEVKKSGQHLFSSGKDNMPLESGDIVKTGKDGTCRIKYHTGLINVVNPDTLMVIQISVTPTGSKIEATVNEGSVDAETPETQKDNEESVLAGKNTKVTIAADSRAAITQDKDTGSTRTQVMEGTGVVEGPLGQRQVLTGGTAVVATDMGLGSLESLNVPPTPVSPRDGEILRLQDGPQQAVNLEWTGAKIATRVQISGKALFSKVLAEQVVRSDSLRLEGLPAGTFYWRIRAEGDPAKAYWSKTFKFRIQQVYKVPQIKRDLKLEVETTAIGDGVILQGSVDPGVSISVNDLEIPVNADGSFNKIVLFGDVGSQTITLRAFDDQGNEKVKPIRFQRSSD